MVEGISLFSFECGRDYAEKVARHLGVALAAHEERDFEDGEFKIRSLENVRGRDVFVVQSLHGDREYSVSDKLCRLLFFIGALADASAASITAVIPYLCFARKDRKTKPRDPVTTRYVASLLEAVGIDRVVTLDVHNLAAFQNAFRCRTDHLEAAKLFASHLGPLLGSTDMAVISPDIGGVKRAEHFRGVLSSTLNRPVSTAFMEKKRSAGVVSGETIVGDVSGKVAVIIDDLISTGTTMKRTAEACQKLGAEKVYAVATHGLFVGQASDVLADPVFDRIIVTDSVPPFCLDPELVRRKVTVLDASALFADAIKRIQVGGSIVDLLEV